MDSKSHKTGIRTRQWAVICSWVHSISINLHSNGEKQLPHSLFDRCKNLECYSKWRLNSAVAHRYSALPLQACRSVLSSLYHGSVSGQLCLEKPICCTPCLKKKSHRLCQGFIFSVGSLGPFHWRWQIGFNCMPEPNSKQNPHGAQPWRMLGDLAGEGD